MGFGFATVTPSATSVAQAGAAAVWTYPQRSLTDIQNLASAIQNNNPNLLSTLSDLLFIPAPYYSGQVSLTQVASFISNLVQNYNAAGVIASFINSNPYSLWHMDFVTNLIQNPYLGFTNASLVLSVTSTSALASIAISTNVPATTILTFISNAALSATAAQALLYGLAQNYYYNKWIQTVTANAPSSITFSTNATLSTNVLIAQNITIASGVTVTCGTTTCFFVAQVFNNQGTIVNPYGATGGITSAGSGGGYGGTGGGGVVIISSTAAIGTINVNGGIGGTASTGSAGGNSYAGVGGQFAVVSGISVPSGGQGGFYSSPPGPGSGEPNGGGGGQGQTGGGANGGSATVYSFANGNALITYIIQGVSDWWLSNVVGKAPQTVTPLLFVYGSGGGGGGVTTTEWGGAGGGGGGGEVIVFGNEVTAGTITAVGGTGGYNPDNIGGGGGGGGGIVLVFYGPGGLSGSMSVNVSGGGTGVSATTASYSGKAGATGVYLATSVTVNG